MKDESLWNDGPREFPGDAPPLDDELRAVFESLIEGTLAPQQVELLDALLVDDAEVRQRYLEYMQMHASLAWVARDSTVAPGATADDSQRTTGKSANPLSGWAGTGGFPTIVPLAMLCMLVFVLGIVLGGQLRREHGDISSAPREIADDDSTEPPAIAIAPAPVVVRESISLPKTPPFATLVEAGGCQWAGSTLPTQAGSRLAKGSLRLKEGRAQIGFDSGAQVVIEGPAVFYLHGPNRTHLESGRLVAHVPPQAIGFTIETQTADIVDLGTEFGVEVAPTGATEVQVLDGEVELGAPRMDDKPASPVVFGSPSEAAPTPPRQRLLVGQARRLDAPPLKGWREVAFKPDEFRRLRPLRDPAQGPWWRVLGDDFDDNELDAKKWKVVTDGIPYGAPSIFEVEGSLSLVDRAHLVTTQEYDPVRLGGLRVTGRWTFKTEGDVFEVLTRSDGQPGGQYGDTLNGITFAAVMERGTSKVGILGRGDVQVPLVYKDMQINTGDVFEFEILDVPGGLSLKMWEASGTGPRIHVHSNVEVDAARRNHVVIHNRNRHREPRVATVDNVVIEQAVRPLRLGADGELRAVSSAPEDVP